MKEQNKPETVEQAAIRIIQKERGQPFHSEIECFKLGYNHASAQMYTAEDCAKMLGALRQRCSEEIKLGDTVSQLQNKIMQVKYHDLIPPLTKQ